MLIYCHNGYSRKLKSCMLRTWTPLLNPELDGWSLMNTWSHMVYSFHLIQVSLIIYFYCRWECFMVSCFWFVLSTVENAYYYDHYIGDIYFSCYLQVGFGQYCNLRFFNFTCIKNYPGPGATIGGMCATRCSGSLAVR